VTDKTGLLDGASRFLAGYRRRDPRNHASLDRYIVNAAKASRGVNERSTPHEEIVHRLCSLSVRLELQA
jgi:hypothetical protein